MRKDVSCSYAGVMYGNGEIWVDPDVADGSLEYRIASVNFSQTPQNLSSLGVSNGVEKFPLKSIE